MRAAFKKAALLKEALKEWEIYIWYYYVILSDIKTKIEGGNCGGKFYQGRMR